MTSKSATITGESGQKSMAKSKIRKALPQILAVLAKNVLIVSHGMIIGYLTILIPGLSGNDPNETFHLNEDQISWIGSISMLCVPIGCLFSGVATQPIGRKRSMQLINIPFLFFWLIMKFANKLWQIYFALAMTGLVGGLVEAPILSYVAEVAEPHLRGVLSASAAFCVIVGVLIQFLLGTFLHWRTIALVSCILPIASFFLLFLVPESPHWLVMKNRMDEARKSLAWLRGWTTIEEIEPELQEICQSQQIKTRNVDGNAKFEIEEPIDESCCKSKLKNARNFARKSFVWPLAVVSFIFFLVHFTGSTTLRTYAVKIFATLQTPLDKYYATVLLGVAEFVGSIVTVFLVHYTGKRVMGFISTIGVGICTLGIATYAHLINVKYFNSDASKVLNPEFEHYKWVPLVLIILLAFISHSGLRVLPWILIGEVFSAEVRSTGCGISGAISYVFGFLANKIFLRMVAVMTIPGTYWFHGALSFIGVIIMYFTLPETEGKTLNEITDHFAGVSKLGNHIGRKTKKNTKEGNDNVAFDNNTEKLN